MERKQNSLVPIGELSVSWTGQCRRSSLRPRPRHHFTQADQVDQLVLASEEDADLGSWRG